jgi:hypothetical protein
MFLPPGTRLGPYEVSALIGVGGMSACGLRRASMRVEPPWRGGGAPRHFLKLTDFAHPGVPAWR